MQKDHVHVEIVLTNFEGNKMAILDNVDNNTYPLFETESYSGVIKIFSETCCNGCSCQSESDHKPV
jgi:hypothetical protein